MIIGSIARRYAKALLSLAVEQDRIEQWSESLDALQAALQASGELRDVLSNPVYDKEQRRAVARRLAQALKLEAEPANMLFLLADRSRLDHLSGIIDAFRSLADEKMGRLRARVVSAVPLDPAAVDGLSRKLAEATRAQVVVDRDVDDGLLGGAVTQVGRFTYDGSLKTQLEILRRTLKQ
jgi:F-type H+-transporting ATPase subunit delta